MSGPEGPRRFSWRGLGFFLVLVLLLLMILVQDSSRSLVLYFNGPTPTPSLWLPAAHLGAFLAVIIGWYNPWGVTRLGRFIRGHSLVWTVAWLSLAGLLMVIAESYRV